jgi:hypothetical protein
MSEPYSVSEKMELLRTLVCERPRVTFGELFAAARSRGEVVCIFLAPAGADPHERGESGAGG